MHLNTHTYIYIYRITRLPVSNSEIDGSSHGDWGENLLGCHLNKVSTLSWPYSIPRIMVKWCDMHFFHDPAMHVASQPSPCCFVIFFMDFYGMFFKISPPIEVRCFHLKQLGTEAEAPLPDARGRQMWHREARWWGAGAELRADFPYNGGFLQWGYPNSWMVYNGLYIYIYII